MGQLFEKNKIPYFINIVNNIIGKVIISIEGINNMYKF